MGWKFWQKDVSSDLSESVKGTIASRFRLDRDTVSRLQVLSKSGEYSGGKVHFIRVYDPSGLEEAAAVTHYDHLNDNEDAVLFDGHVGEDMVSSLNARRARRASRLRTTAPGEAAEDAAGQAPAHEEIGTSGWPVQVLLVEDNPGDARLVEEAVKETEIHSNLSIAEDGEKALAILRKEGGNEDSPRPDLILLDLNLPGMSGQDILSEIKSNEELNRIPVVVVTGTQAEQDLLRADNPQVNTFVTKPITAADFTSAVTMAKNIWAAISRLPSGS